MTRTPMSPLVLVLVLWLAGLGSAAQFAKIAVVLPELQQFYGETGAVSGFLVSLISLLGIVFGMVAGLLAIRFGLRRLLLTGLYLGAAISFLQALMPPFELMLASRFVEGFSHLAIVVVTPTLIAQIAPQKHQGAALTLWGTFFGVAFAAVAQVAPPIVDRAGLPALFSAHGVWMLAFAVIVTRSIPYPPTASIRPDSIGIAAIIARHRAAYANPAIAAPALGWVCYTLTFVALLAVLPPLLEPGERVIAATWMPLASIASSMTIGVFLLRHISAIGVVIAGFATSLAVSALFFVTGPNLWVGIVLFACLGLVQGASFAAVPQLNALDADRTLANGGLAQMGNLGNTAGTPLMLAIFAATGFVGLPVLLIVCYLAAIAIHLAFARMRARSGPLTSR